MENNSAIRTMFEEGDKMRAEYGPENVYDFSLGNPDAPVPAEVKQSIIDILNEEDPTALHGYMSKTCVKPSHSRLTADSAQPLITVIFS